MQVKRTPGYIKLNGEPYVVIKNPQTNEFAYSRDSGPKSNVQTAKRNALTGKSNLVEIKFDATDGYGAFILDDAQDRYHYATNFLTERPAEWVALPAPRAIIPDEGTEPTPLINHIFAAPVSVWEQKNEFYSPQPNETFFLADHRAFSIRVLDGMEITLDEDFFFEGSAQPTGGATVNNDFYAAMGGGQRPTDRFIRKRISTSSGITNGTWSHDDNNTIAILSVEDDGGSARFVVASHDYVVGDVVYITDAVEYNGLWTISAVVGTTKFTISTLNFGSTSTGFVNVQDSDVKAEHLVLVADLLVRSFYDSTNGWQVARVDPIGSNPLLDANWTAGIGTLGAGDTFEPITGLVAVGDGEMVLKADGAFTYDGGVQLYTNQIPELNFNRHPDNGKGSFVWKGWVYIPTVIGLLRWKNGVVQDVTPGRGSIQNFETPGFPVAWLTGDSNKLYAVSKAFSQNVNLNGKEITARFGLDKTGDGTPEILPVVQGDFQNLFDGDNQTFVDLLGMTDAGFIYIGYENPWHRVNFTIQTGLRCTSGSGSTELSAQFWNGTSWVDENIDFDGTMGWNNTDDDPCTLNKSGDIAIGYIDPSWEKGATTTGGTPIALSGDYYWRRYSANFSDSTAASASFGIHEVHIGAHSSATTFEPMLTSEIGNDHGGAVYILSMTEEQGRGVIWRTMWTFNSPDLLHPDSNTALGQGGGQKVGVISVVQPDFLRAKVEGERWMFIGMEGISYMLPLGNRPDPSNEPFQQLEMWHIDEPNPGSVYNVGPRSFTIVTGHTDCGLSLVDKTLKEITFTNDGFDLSSCEVYYSVDGGPWTFVGFGDDQTPNMPIVLPEGAEPVGRTFALALSFDEADARTLDLPRITDLAMRVQPRPEMSDVIEMTVELESEKEQPGTVDRRSAKNRYADLKVLQEQGTSVEFHGPDGVIEQAQVLQISQKFIHNSDNVPKLVATIWLTMNADRTEAA